METTRSTQTSGGPLRYQARLFVSVPCTSVGE